MSLSLTSLKLKIIENIFFKVLPMHLLKEKEKYLFSYCLHLPYISSLPPFILIQIYGFSLALCSPFFSFNIHYASIYCLFLLLIFLLILFLIL